MIFDEIKYSHIPLLVEREAASTPYPWTQSMLEGSVQSSANCCRIIIADQTIGYWVVQSVADEAELLNFVIFSPYQSQGFGRNVVERLKVVLAKQKIKTILLEVRTSNIPARRLYQAAGFIQMGKRKQYYRTEIMLSTPEKEDALILQCGLGEP